MIVENLINSVLEDAIKGNLTTHDYHDLSAFDLVTKLLAKRKELTAEKKILKKPFLDNESIEIPFDIPENWAWAYLSNISIIQEGAGIRKHQYKESGIQLFSVTNILDGDIDLEKKQLYVSEEEYRQKYSHLKLNIGDIVTACSGGSWGKVAIYGEPNEVMLNTSTLRLRFFEDLGNNKYLYYVVKSDYFKKCLSKQLAGIQPNFGYAHYSTIPIPIPPLEEQGRIVEKIEEILGKLEEVKPVEEELFELKSNFGIEMRNSILDYAIKGKLNTGSKEDSDVNQIIPKSDVYKDNAKKFDLSINDKHSFDIPENWAWVKIGQLFSYCNGYAYKPTEASKSGKGFPIIKSQNIMSLKVEINSQTSFVENPNDKMLKSAIHKGDFLMCLSSQSSNPEPLGKTAIYNNDEIALLNQRVLKLTPYNNSYSEYLYYVINSFYFHYNVSHKGGGSAQSNLKLEHVMEMEVPLPPIEEQERIVNKIEKILPIIDNINALV